MSNRHDSESRSVDDQQSQASRRESAAIPRDLTAMELSVLHDIVEGTAATVGVDFFQSLVRHLASALEVKFAFVAEFLGGTRARTLAYWKDGRQVDSVEWDLRGTPCEDVVYGSMCHHPTGVSSRFPDDRPMVEMGIDSYLGVPLRDTDGATLGHLAVFHDGAMSAEPRRLFVFKIFAARAASELIRLRAERMLRESEVRFRDLYEEAPNAYVSLDSIGRLINVNRRMVDLLGYSEQELIGTRLVDYLIESDESAPRPRLAALLSGAGEIAGDELELRCRNGTSVWVSLWFRPPTIRHGAEHLARAVLVDVTARVRAERERQQLSEQNVYLQEEIRSDRNFDEIVGNSEALSAVLRSVEQVAPTDTSVLITGETGTGKELIARAIHSAGTRRDKPLIRVNCAALPFGLVESELFGHERGAFSGAIARRIGRFELADGGTLFLDEIGEISHEVQAKLLRVIQEGEFERLGDSRTRRVDVRLIAATNRDLAECVRDGSFREDLFYRINVFPIHAPPLRERPDDIPLLVQFFAQRYASRTGRSVQHIGREALNRLTGYSWPGNVRELENVIERAVILSSGESLEISHVLLGGSGETSPIRARSAPDNVTDSYHPRYFASDDSEVPPHQYAPPSATMPTVDNSQLSRMPSTANTPRDNIPLAPLSDVQRSHILSALETTGWVIDGPRGAAQILGLHPNTLRSRLKKLGIQRPAHEKS